MMRFDDQYTLFPFELYKYVQKFPSVKAEYSKYLENMDNRLAIDLNGDSTMVMFLQISKDGKLKSVRLENVVDKLYLIIALLTNGDLKKCSYKFLSPTVEYAKHFENHFIERMNTIYSEIRRQFGEDAYV